ncbi:MAG TPA: hypothetical protein VMJ93_16550 [Verrucomicrobiae bacterium]|nr:hypothetical protein [Verrucomicrobiae bacterium]
MNRLRTIAIAIGIFMLAAISTSVPRAKAVNPAVAQFDSSCVSYVPREWGQYRGGSGQSGLAFEDSSGTLRFVTNLPCGAVPVIALEIRRAASKN